MIRGATRLQLVVFALLAVLGIAYVGGTYVGVNERLFGRGFTVTADFPDSGGIYENAEVTYRGVTVGRVEGLRLSGTGVYVDLHLEEGVQIPAVTRAVVANRSAVGEQYVDLQPESPGPPYLKPGDIISRANTATPISTTTLLVNLDRLVNSVDREDLSIVIGELGAAFDDGGRDLQRLIDSGNALTEAATDALPETIKLIEDGQTVLATQNEQAGTIKSFARDLALLTDTFRDSDSDIRQILDGGSAASREISDLLQTTEPTLPILIGNLITVNQVTSARIPNLRQILVTYPAAVEGGFTVAPGDGTSHFGLVLNASDPPACTSGYASTRQRVPQEQGEVSANREARCTAAPSSQVNVRGAQNAPKARGGPEWQPDDTGGGSGPGSAAEEEPASAPSPDAVYVAGYDPVTGLAVGPDGRPIIIGSRGGQQRLLGEDSWKWLLLAPLGG